MTTPTAAAAAVVGEDPRVGLLIRAINQWWDQLLAADQLADPSAADEAAAVLEVLDRWDEQHNILRVPAARLRVLEQDRSRLRAALFAAVEAFEEYPGPVWVGAPPTGVSAPSVPVPVMTVEHWRILAEGGF